MQLFVVLLHFASVVLATNDWSTACHAGQCAWDVPPSSNYGGSASLQLWSTSPSAIADITPAAGWAVLTCSGSMAAQTVRIACVDPSSGCSHLLDRNTNPMGRIVRLTDECGIMPFARITHMRLSADQTLPSVLSRRTMPPVVYDVALDMDFDAAGSEHETVNFAVTASSSPDVRAGTIERVPRGRFQSRVFADEQEQLVKREYVARSLKELTARSDDHSFNQNKSAAFLVHVNRTANVFNSTMDCKAGSVPFDTSVTADVDAVADARFTFGIVIAGTTVPLKLEMAAITAQMSGSIDGALRVQANAEGKFSKSITLFDFPLPGGIVIPGFLQLGPAFKVKASADADLGNAIDTTIGLSYRIEDASFVFPAEQGHSNGSFIPNETPLQISLDTNVTGSVSLTGHLIPELVIGIDAFKGAARIQSEFAFSLDASASVAVNNTEGIASGSNSSAVVSPPGACVDVSTALAVSAGVDAKLFGLFNWGPSVNLFDGSYDLYGTCTDPTGVNSTSSDNSTTSTNSVRSPTGIDPPSSNSSGLSPPTYHWSARAVPVPVDAPRVTPVEAQSLNRHPTLTCPGLPHNIHTPTATATVSPKASHL